MTCSASNILLETSPNSLQQMAQKWWSLPSGASESIDVILIGLFMNAFKDKLILLVPPNRVILISFFQVASIHKIIWPLDC
jgi:hypothetical protein